MTVPRSWSCGPTARTRADSRATTSSAASKGRVDWSPAGNRLLTSTQDGRLVTIGLDGTVQRTTMRWPWNDGFFYEASWAPDGKHIVFSDGSNGGTDIATTDGSEVTRLTDPPGNDRLADWTSATP
jgi:Tol biopolymer transport system component